MFVLLLYAGIAVAAESPVNPFLQTGKSEVLTTEVHFSSCLPFGESCTPVEEMDPKLPKTNGQPSIVHFSSCLPFGESCTPVEEVDPKLPKTNGQPSVSSNQGQ
jgi:hypothetical protein